MMFDFKRLSKADLVHLAHDADAMERLERSFLLAYGRELGKHEEQVFRWLAHHDRPEPDIDLLDFVIVWVGKIIRKGMFDTPKPVRLGAPLMPKDLPTLRQWYDAMRRKPTRKLKTMARKLKKAYLDQIQETWKKSSEDWRAGKQWTQDEIRASIRKAAKVSVKRATVIASTETTRYYNQARRQRYDQVTLVTHYLYMAIRDKATTKWCKTRHGLVLTKGTAALDKSTPPIHFNCRSQLLPLVRTNPRHKKLIDDESLRIENKKVEHLPPGWNA